MEWKCWKSAFIRKNFSIMFLKTFFCCGSALVFVWACQRFVGIRVGWLTMTALKHFKVEVSVWCLQTVQTRFLDIIAAAWHAVKQASTCHTSLPARKGEVRRVSSLFQIWIRWLNARVAAACRGLCCSPRSTETAPPSGCSRSTARIAPVKVGWDLKRSLCTTG